MTQKTITIDLGNSNSYPYWGSIDVEFNQNEEGNWVADENALIDLVVAEDNVYEGISIDIPSITLTDAEIENEDLSEYAEEILNHIENPEDSEDYQEYVEENGNEFANEGTQKFEISLNGYDVDCSADFSVDEREWVVTVSSSEINEEQEFSFGEGNSFDSIEELQEAFEERYLDEIEMIDNNFTEEGPYDFDLEIKGKDVEFTAQYDGQWVVSSDELEVEYRFGNGSSFNDIDELQDYFGEKYLSDIISSINEELEPEAQNFAENLQEELKELKLETETDEYDSDIFITINYGDNYIGSLVFNSEDDAEELREKIGLIDESISSYNALKQDVGAGELKDISMDISSDLTIEFTAENKSGESKKQTVSNFMELHNAVSEIKTGEIFKQASGMKM
ncbi:hypothetical protein [Gluconobacter cerinus]|uniref:hypothetical protein n=1 Tax=Gluconobacter cerinus TaxID=38307 RepID=UPI001B8D244C|nr:hypothetical protein [Gluconobacter cerinus]MBS1038071.1 hypothetical protein [Gluconobacter cerinus]